ncbi:hypothetical protein PVK06_027032 [Gossypium arboreum]|uniref:Uncharacterized protein n=1 Tax=Gossypium arboreum TaxID=29729 RepID=A0ABR0P1S2_GOSAR|nr:hypothetical protein PVK06_027032 [Gossypium arboreum]
MDRGKKPLEQVGEWTTVHKKPNKGKSITPNQGFIKSSPQPSFYSNQGYYISYPMVRPPVGSQLYSTPGIDLITTAQHILQHQTYKLWTNGRRIVADDTGNIQKDRDEESLKLLKKIADIEIDDYPSHETLGLPEDCSAAASSRSLEEHLFNSPNRGHQCTVDTPLMRCPEPCLSHDRLASESRSDRLCSNDLFAAKIIAPDCATIGASAFITPAALESSRSLRSLAEKGKKSKQNCSK